MHFLPGAQKLALLFFVRHRGTVGVPTAGLLRVQAPSSQEDQGSGEHKEKQAVTHGRGCYAGVARGSSDVGSRNVDSSPAPTPIAFGETLRV
jgi:hypothetical protein